MVKGIESGRKVEEANVTTCVIQWHLRCMRLS